MLSAKTNKKKKIDNRNQLEKQFGKLISWIKNKYPKEQFQNIISTLSEQDIPNFYRRSFRFFHSLDGASKDLLWHVTFKHDCKKQFIRRKHSSRFKTRYK